MQCKKVQFKHVCSKFVKMNNTNVFPSAYIWNLYITQTCSDEIIWVAAAMKLDCISSFYYLRILTMSYPDVFLYH